MSTLEALWPALGLGDTWLAILLSSIGLWLFFLLIRRGVKEAAAINRIVTVAKLVPIIVFVLIAIFCFKPDVFAGNLMGADYAGSLMNQVRDTMLVTVFVFMGVEGASVYSRHAQKREDVGRATVLGFLSVFAIFASVTVVSYGILPMGEIAQLRQPSMAGVLEAAVGPWGTVFVSVGLIISVLGAYLAWSLMAAEVLFVAAKDQDMPKFLSKATSDDVPVNALLLSALLSQVVLIITYFSEEAFDFALDLTAALSLIPYFLAAAYAVKLVLTRETYDTAAVGVTRTWRVDTVISVLAAVYTLFLIYAAGLQFLLISFIFYAPATILFVITRREQNRRVFSTTELVLFIAVLVGALVGVLGLVQGWIQI